MMTPLLFEQRYRADWSELELNLNDIADPKGAAAAGRTPPSGDQVAVRYRRACDHLALARGRSYPAYLIDRLERLTSQAHQVIYYRRDFGFAQLRQLIGRQFPSCVRAHARYVGVAALTFLVPCVAIAVLVHSRPDLILSVVSSETADTFEQMYSTSTESIGRVRNASTDWVMFGYYIRNNISIAFQCFAGGLFAGLGSLFFLGYNGAFSGALAGYLTARGLSSTFFPFVSTHSAFELTAIILSGAAGLRIGHALVAPRRLSRIESLVEAARETVVLLYGITAMLLIAAGIEAFWSSARWLPATIKYTSAAICWTAVLDYFLRQGRRAS
jgi:uncharacterized membrane protein SpoIIM required for sporulation